jgi:hypothetical protein
MGVTALTSGNHSVDKELLSKVKCRRRGNMIRIGVVVCSSQRIFSVFRVAAQLRSISIPEEFSPMAIDRCCKRGKELEDIVGPVLAQRGQWRV